jgi:hypothetical protein
LLSGEQRAADQRRAESDGKSQQTGAQQGVWRTGHTAAPEWKYFSIACVPDEIGKVIGLGGNSFWQEMVVRLMAPSRAGSLPH